MSLETEGRAGLIAYFSLPDAVSQAELARRVGVSGASVSAWKAGTSRPEPHYRQALEREIGLGRETWMTAEERAIAQGE